MDTKRHTSKQYETELQEVKESLLYLGALTQQAIEDSIRALLDRDTGLARKVIANDAFIDKLDGEVEEKCIRLLALRQPAARDLRFITTAIKINGHLERIGDMAVKICEKVALLNEEAQLKPYIDLPRMAEIARGMIRKSLDALVKEDVALANEVRREDEAVDSLNEQIFRELLTFMMEDPRTIHRSLLIMQISKTVERISDHAKGIADMVVFMITGKNVRHQWPFDEEEAIRPGGRKQVKPSQIQ
ncbi:MAG TPA: phosphate signaling complex protein PhoU [Syntrophales bacterium]|jgi:phosphate transport system protein|nr:phosphate signaling complex protein PhoU [Syntrophales bacterium]HOD98867.1 phosphate signaling complex protein PhoU [Syntrophales bacterium]HOH73549.1 phosphate signaling complex protein PhoU [Syntrophales bacterium]HQB14313.1 phosphate signaling complex protein PhoU [Syntrophales bacterium]